MKAYRSLSSVCFKIRQPKKFLSTVDDDEAKNFSIYRKRVIDKTKINKGVE